MQISHAVGKDYLAAGATVYSLQSNTGVRNISDFRGRRMGVGHHLLPSSYQLGFEVRKETIILIHVFFSDFDMDDSMLKWMMRQMLTEHGLNMWIDPSQVKT